MDYVFFAFLALFFVRGLFKGFVEMLFSLLGVFAIIVVSWKLCDVFAPMLEKVFDFSTFTTRLIDGEIPGKFTNIQDLENAISNTKFGLLFGLFLFRFTKNITFVGEMTAGQILSPTICDLAVKVLTFGILFVTLFVAIKIVRLVLRKLIKKCGLSATNRIFGGLFGAIKGLLIFGAFYFVMTAMANLLLNENLVLFVQSGKICKFIYDAVLSVFY